MQPITEDTRNQILNTSKAAASYKGDQSKGKNRYFRRTKSKISSSVAEYNSIDMNKLYKEDLLDFHVKVHGETDDYLVRLSFSGVVKNISDQLKDKTENDINFGLIMRALIKCFKTDDVYIYCNCPDFNYRLGYFASVHNLIAGSKETRPSDETNPHDQFGAACKHICLVLSNTSWINKVCSTINNYINYVKQHYEKQYKNLIFPKLFGMPYDEYIELQTGQEEIDKSNAYGRTRTQFKPGNKEGIRFAKNDESQSDNSDEKL